MTTSVDTLELTQRMPNMRAERRHFEHFARLQGLDLRQADERYLNPATDLAWRTWRVRAWLLV